MNILIALAIVLVTAFVVFDDARRAAPPRPHRAGPTRADIDDVPEAPEVEETLDPDHFLQTRTLEPVRTSERVLAVARLAGSIALTGAALGFIVVTAARALGALLRRWAGS